MKNICKNSSKDEVANSTGNKMKQSNLSDVYNSIKKIHDKIKGIPHMSFKQAELLVEFITKNDISNILELGFAHGVSTLYMAGILESLNGGNIISIDTKAARNRNPNIEQLFSKINFTKTNINVFYEPKSYLWQMMKMIEQNKHNTFDFCYLDGAHDWYTDGFAFFLVDKLLKKDGWIIFDDIDWTYSNSPSLKDSEFVKNLPEDEKNIPQIKKVFDLLVKQHPSYSNFLIKDGWGYAQKVGKE